MTMPFESDALYQRLREGLLRDLGCIKPSDLAPLADYPSPIARYKSPWWTNERREKALRLAADGKSVDEISRLTGVKQARVSRLIRAHPSSTSGKEVRRNGSQDHDESAGQARDDDVDQDEGRNEASVVAGDQEDGQALAQ